VGGDRERGALSWRCRKKVSPLSDLVCVAGEKKGLGRKKDKRDLPAEQMATIVRRGAQKKQKGRTRPSREGGEEDA